jgi:hypothetical protein
MTLDEFGCARAAGAMTPVANDPEPRRHGKANGIDFVGNSKISSFPQNPLQLLDGILIP